MKTTIIFISLLMPISGSIMGQSGKITFPDYSIKDELSISNDLLKNNQIDSVYNEFRNFDLSIARNFRLPDFNKDMVLQHSRRGDRSKKSADAEEFPGSARFYGYNRDFVPDTTDSFFLKRPDPDKKYYLIIKDPFHHTVTR